MEVIKEDNAETYSKNLARRLAINFKEKGDETAFCANFNKDRVPRDNVLNYPDSKTFAKEVLEYFKKNYTSLYNRYKNIIEDLAKEYADMKLKRIKMLSKYKLDLTSVKTKKCFNY